MPLPKVTAAQVLEYYKHGGRTFKGMDLSGEDFARCDLAGVDFSGSNLDGACFREAILSGCRMNGTDAHRTNFRYAMMTQSNLDRIRADGADFLRADMRECSLNDAFLRQADLTGARLDDASLRSVRAPGASFSWARLERADMTDAQLHRCLFHNAHLHETRMIAVETNGADFSDASVWKTNFSMAQLVLSDFTGATATRENPDTGTIEHGAPDFRSTFVNRGILIDVILRDADFSGAVILHSNFSGADLRGALLDEDTTLLHLVDIDDALRGPSEAHEDDLPEPA